MNFIPPILLGLFLFAALIVLVAEFMGKKDAPLDLMDEETPCSWCQAERAIKAQPHESHSICARHKAQLLADAKRFSKSVHA